MNKEVQQFAFEAMNRLCDRCSYGDTPYREQWHDGEFHWVHGVDWRGEVYINPEPCKADIIHELLREAIKEK